MMAEQSPTSHQLVAYQSLINRRPLADLSPTDHQLSAKRSPNVLHLIGDRLVSDSLETGRGLDSDNL